MGWSGRAVGRTSTVLVATASLVVTLVPAAAAIPAASRTGPVERTTSPTPTAVAASNAACEGEVAWSAYTREPTFGTRTLSNLPIEMSDGVTLYADVVLPDEDGPWPAIVTQTAYSKDLLGASAHFPPRGYATVTVDLRGTGTSEGGWDPFSPREQRDGYEVFEWVVDQDWSDGRTAGYGASYLGLTQLFSAAQQPRGLRALFPIVPVADPYRDIVLMGGQVNVAFMPLWITLVTGLGIVPNSRFVDDPAGALEALLDHLLRLIEPDSTVALILGAVTGDPEIVHDGPFWQQRAPINVVQDIEVPTFVTGGLNDLFQRGEPLLYEALAGQVPTKLLMGPWGHLEGSSGAGLAAAGLPRIEDIALRWFDEFVLGLDTGIACVPDVTQWNWGPEEYRAQPDWPHPDLTAVALHLDAGGLRADVPEASSNTVLPPVPLAGLCSRSTSQWLMGILDQTGCAQDNQPNELLEATFTSPPLDEDLVLNGPAAAQLWLSTTGTETATVVRLTSVAPGGTSRELTNGLLLGSYRELDESRTRTLDGHILQPYHPFTAASRRPMPRGEATRVDVELFPTAAVVPAGHRLRVSIGAADVPHAISPLPDLAATLLQVTSVVTGPDTPSSIVLPVVGAASEPPPSGDGAVAGDDRRADGEDRGATGDRGASDDRGASSDGRGGAEVDPAAASREAEVVAADVSPARQPLPVTGGGPVALGALLLAFAALGARGLRRPPAS